LRARLCPADSPTATLRGGGVPTARGARAVRAVIACSMERRPGPEFAFNEPLVSAPHRTAQRALMAGLVAVRAVALSTV
jgi:hypothetical protein